jgi:integrase
MARKRGVLVPIDGIKSYRSKGRWYHYDRVTGERIAAEPGTPEFLAEVRLLRASAPGPALASGTLGDVIRRYKGATAYWGVLKAPTKVSYERAFAALDVIKCAPMAAMTRPAILNLRDEVLEPKHGRWLANYAVTVLGLLFRYAKDHGVVSVNPLEEKVRKIRRPPDAPKANRPWTEDERKAVFAEAPPHILLPLALGLCVGLRYTDIFTVPLAALRYGDIAVRTSKRDVPILVPIHPVLANALARRPKSDAPEICVTIEGKAWKMAFNASWARFRARLLAEGKIGKGLTLHGLRHTLGKMLKEAGLSDGDIADILGQSGTSMARHYSREADLPETSKAVVVGLNWAGENRYKAV